jgi:hypothetical protein
VIMLVIWYNVLCTAAQAWGQTALPTSDFITTRKILVNCIYDDAHQKFTQLYSVDEVQALSSTSFTPRSGCELNRVALAYPSPSRSWQYRCTSAIFQQFQSFRFYTSILYHLVHELITPTGIWLRVNLIRGIVE